MSSNEIKIDNLPPAVMVEQDDLIVIVQDGTTKRATVADVQAAATIGPQSFLTANAELLLPQSRKVTVGPNLLITDNGPLSTFNISITGLLGSLASLATSGVIVNNGGTVVTRLLVAPPAGITIANPDGVAGNPTFALANDLLALENLPGPGLAAHIGPDTWATRTLVEPPSGITISSPDGVTGNPTFALANDLAALEALPGIGIVVRNAPESFVNRTMISPPEGLAIVNPSGDSGNMTFQLRNDLAALEALSSTGYATRVGADTWAQRVIMGTANEIAVVNGDGVAGNTTFSLPATLTFTGKTITGGTFTGGTFTGGTLTPTTLTVKDNAFTVQDDVDPTKQFQFQASSIPTATTRTYTVPSVNDTLAGILDTIAIGAILG